MSPFDDSATLALAVALSLLIGTLMGLIGGGGGFVYVFVLIVILGVAPATAVGTGLLLAAAASTVALARHWRDGNVRPARARPLVLAGCVLAAGGAALTAAIPEAVLRWLVIGLFVVLSIQPIASARRARAAAAPRARDARTPEALGVGGLVGFGVGAFGISGGAPLSSWLIGRAGLGAVVAVGTAMLVVVPVSVAGAVVHVGLGSVSAAWFAVLGAGAAIGAWLGAGLTARIDERVLAITLGVLTLATSVGLAVGV